MAGIDASSISKVIKKICPEFDLFCLLISFPIKICNACFPNSDMYRDGGFEKENQRPFWISLIAEDSELSGPNEYVSIVFCSFLRRFIFQ